MINWLTENIGTGPYLAISEISGDFTIIDVRNLVDKDGNKEDEILLKIDEGLNLLNGGKKIVVCCDYGMSRSNSIAAGIIARYQSISFFEAVSLLQKKVPAAGIKVEVLNAVFNAVKTTGFEKKNDVPRILITGGGGFVGTMLAKSLDENFFIKSISSKDVDLINNPVLLDVLVKENEINTLIHLANPRIYTLNKAMGDSMVMLKNVLESCRLNDVKLMYVSSWEVYSGYRSNELLADENTPLFPKGAYGETKWLSEQLIQHYNKLFGMKYSILRSSPVYGSSSDKPKFIYNFIDKARKDEKIMTHNYLNGSPTLDLLHIDDFISAMSKCIDFPGNETFNVGSGKLLSTLQIAELIVRRLKSKSVIDSTGINSYYSNIKMDCSKAMKLLSWKPVNTFQNYLNKINFG
ncbi:MAG: NAD-dependent epimerase/dehydratase family protein [Chitinophagaceae bacterium]